MRLDVVRGVAQPGQPFLLLNTVLSHDFYCFTGPQQLVPPMIFKGKLNPLLMGDRLPECLLVKTRQWIQPSTFPYSIDVRIRIARTCLVQSLRKHEQHMCIPVNRPVLISASIFQKWRMVILLNKRNVAAEGPRLLKISVGRVAEQRYRGVPADIALLVSPIDTRRGDIAAAKIPRKAYQFVFCIPWAKHENKVACLRLQPGIELDSKHGLRIVLERRIKIIRVIG